MQQRNRLTSVLMILFSLAFVAVTAIVSARLAEETRPEQTGATGFGPTATRDLFAKVNGAFAGVQCNTIFSNEDIAEVIPSKFAFGKIRFTDDGVPDNTVSKWCIYNMDNGKTLSFYLYPYQNNSEIDNYRNELYTRVNGNTLTNSVVFGHGNYFDVDYYLGQDDLGIGECRSNLFHFQNDFEYASIVYKGFGNNCEALYELNDLVSSIFSDKIAVVMDSVNLANGVTFENLFLDYDFKSSQ